MPCRHRDRLLDRLGDVKQATSRHFERSIDLPCLVLPYLPMKPTSKPAAVVARGRQREDRAAMTRPSGPDGDSMLATASGGCGCEYGRTWRVALTSRNQSLS